MRRLLARARRRAAARALLLVAALAAGGCASMGIGVEPIEVNLVDIVPLPSTAYEHRMRVDLRLRNPNPQSFEIDGLRFRLEVNGQRLATGLADVQGTLPRLGELVVPVTTTTTLVELVNQIVRFGRREQPHFEYVLRGRVFLAGWGDLDFEHRGTSEDLVPRTDGAPSPPPAEEPPPP